MATDDQFEKSWLAAQALAKKFTQNSSHYLSSEYQEAEVRQDFVDKFYKALGWDVGHDIQHDPYRREVRIEKPEKKSKGRADYAFSIAPHYRRVRFFVEAKRPQENIKTPDNCFQAIRYSWPKGLPIAVLTDFNYLHIIDSRFRPNINSATSRVARSWHHSDMLDREKFAEIYYLLSRQAVANGSLDIFAETELPPLQVAAKQYTLFAGEARDFDDDFLNKLDEWRETLAAVFKRAQNELNSEELTECVQRTLDRLIFIRFLEDKGIEPDAVIVRFGQHSKTHWQDFVAACKRLDRTYNGVVFKPHRTLDDSSFEPDSAIFSNICDELTDEHSPYNFDSIPVEILGRIYERFLGKIVLAKRKTIEVVEKEDVRKAGGVFYTPDYIVAYMVEHSLGQQTKGKKPEDILKLRIIDTACGSGSFLIGVFAHLTHELAIYWRKQSKHPKGVVEVRDGEAHLTLQYKRQILLNCIYGVDIDPQAVEVAQLSLYLKLLEEETTDSANQQKQLEIGVALLPSLSRNIVMGNSLVTLEDEGGDLFSVEKLHELKSLDFKAAFPQIFRDGGFDLLIGNPPYIKEYTNREAFDHVRNSPYYLGKMDIWYLFACRGLDWLKSESGTLAYIATNNWVTNAGAKKLREKITRDARIEQLIDFGDYKVFRDAGIQTMILIARRSTKPNRYTFDYRRLTGNKRTLADAQGLLEKLAGSGREYLEPSFDRSRASSSLLTFSASGLETLLDKVAGKQNFELDGKNEVAQGIVSPQDFLNAKGRASLGGHIPVGHGIFNLTHQEKRDLHLNKVEQTLVKPFFTTAELDRYYGNNENQLWVIYTDSRFKDANEIAPYPNFKKHLDQFKSVITSDNHPYGLHRARDEKFFTGEKIISVRKCSEPTFTYTDFPCYVSQTFNIIKTDRVNLLYLTALLNSRLVRFWLKHRGKMQGQNFQVDKEPLLAIPLCVPEKSEQERLAKITKRIIECKQKMAGVTTDSAQMQLQRSFEQFEEQLEDAITTIYGLNESDHKLIICN
jgi:adenine-specific DNA-methyltransferase